MLVAITLVDTVGVVVLIAAAEVMDRENGFEFLVPAAADVPGADETPTSQDR